MFNRDKSIILLVLILLSATLSAQDQMTTLTTTGSGPSKEIAVQKSLRSAIEQAFGAFISAKTEILNDEIVSDEITSVSGGNIQEYELLSEVYNTADSSYFVTTKVTVSVSKLTAFVQSKGVEVEIKGGLFAANMIQQELNAKSEYVAVKNMLVPFHEAMLQSYDFNLTTSDPVLEDKEPNKWKIALSVNATANANFDLAFSIVENTLRGITLSEEEIQEYKKLGRDVYPVFLWKDNEALRIGAQETDPDWGRGTLLSEIAAKYNISIDSVKNRLSNDNLDYFNFTWFAAKSGETLKYKIDTFGTPLEANVGGEGKYQYLKFNTSADRFFWENTRDVFYLRNERSKALLDEVVEKHLDIVYGNHFDVLSNVHNYYSYPDVAVRLDTTQLQAVGHSIVIEGHTSSIDRIFYNIYSGSWSKHEHKNKYVYRLDNGPKVEYVKNWVKISKDTIYADMPESTEWKGHYSSELDFSMLMFRRNRGNFLWDILKMNDLRNLIGYSVKASDNVFSHENGGVTIRNGVNQLVLPLIEEEGSNCQCDTLKLEGYNDWQEASADVYLQLYEQYLWMYGPKEILTTSLNKDIVAYSPYHYPINSELIPDSYYIGVSTKRTRLRFLRRSNYQRVDFSIGSPAVICVRLLNNLR